MPISLPSLDVLKTFVVVAQRLNFTHAARELHLTQGRSAGKFSGWSSARVIRCSAAGRGLALTPQGAQLLAPVQQALGQLDEALTRAAAPPGRCASNARPARCAGCCRV